ncbi:hypothetical protein [Flexibacterium corallicola]|uniref:hypothetical protein n=1 Tax=Flexibacterium corallicola TaxID=3037259 RepID=UPI00286EDBDE|nr:hypothetical protein [Pseudovibrio sp. M1P-2-3]
MFASALQNKERLVLAALIATLAINGFTHDAVMKLTRENADVLLSPVYPLVLCIALYQIIHDKSSLSHVWLGTFAVISLSVALVPSSLIAWSVLLVLCVASYIVDRGSRRSYLIIMGLCFVVIWRAIGLKVAGTTLYEIEAWVIAKIYSTFIGSAESIGTLILAEGGQPLVMRRDCSAFSQMGTVIIGFAAFYTLANGNRPFFAWWLPTLVTSIVLLNLGRLLLMAHSPETYEFAHGPDGGMIYDGLLSLLIVMGAFWPSADTVDTENSKVGSNN